MSRHAAPSGTGQITMNKMAATPTGPASIANLTYGAAQHAPSSHDPVVRDLSEVAGGPAGRRRALVPNGSGFRWGPAPVLALLAMATMILTQLVNQPCRSRLWQSPSQFIHVCYSDVPAAVGGTHAPQSAGNWLLTSLVGGLAPGGFNHLRTAVDLMTILLALGLCLLVLAVVRLAGHRPWDAAIVALSPVVVTAGMVSTDLVAIAAAMGGLALMLPTLGDDVTAFPGRAPGFARLVAAGVLIGLAASVRPVALVVLLALVMCLLRARTETGFPHRGGIGPVLIGAAAGWLIPNAAQFVASPQQWWEYPQSLLKQDLGYGSLLVIPRLLSKGIPADQRDLSAPLWAGFIGIAVLAIIALISLAIPAPQRREWMPLHDRGVQVAAALVVLAPLVMVLAGPVVLRSLTTSPPGAGAGRVLWGVGSLAVLAGVALLVTTALRRPRVPVVALLLAIGLLLVSPAVPVQAGLWLLPLIALALPSWRLVLAWSAAEALYAAATWLYIFGLSEPNRGLPVGWYAFIALIRIGAWVAVAWQAVQISRQPAVDPVRGRPDPLRGAMRDDPAAGLIDR